MSDKPTLSDTWVLRQRRRFFGDLRGQSAVCATQRRLAHGYQRRAIQPPAYACPAVSLVGDETMPAWDLTRSDYEQMAALRSHGLKWSVIAARLGRSEGTLRVMFSATGEDR